MNIAQKYVDVIPMYQFISRRSAARDYVILIKAYRPYDAECGLDGYAFHSYLARGVYDRMREEANMQPLDLATIVSNRLIRDSLSVIRFRDESQAQAVADSLTAMFKTVRVNRSNYYSDLERL